MLSLLITIAAAVGAFEFRDSFNYPDGTDGAPAWYAESVAWEVKDGVLECRGGGRSFAILEQAPHGTDLSVEASITVRERVGTEWSVAGVCVRRDGNNFWHLALIEAPPAAGKTHRVELTEMLDNTWLAQGLRDSQLTNRVSEGSDFDWQYGRPYRLKLVLSPKQIEGFVIESDGTQRAHLAFALDNRAVTSGQPALDCGGFYATFDDAAVVVDQESPKPQVPTQAFPPYTLPLNPAISAAAKVFFYTKEINGRWWLIDPNGQAFYVVGTDHINYRAHWCQKLGYAPYARNVEAKYGSEEKWGDTALQRLSEWNFNTLPAGHSPSLRHRRFPHIEFLSLGTSFSDVDDLCPKTTWTGFPNVFSPKWARHCDKLARQACSDMKDDPWLIGYFLDNELEWFGKSYKPWGLFDEAWKKPAGHSAKVAWVAFLKQELGTPEALATHWGASVPDFDALARDVTPRAPLTEQARAIAERWVRLVAEKYYQGCTEAIRRHDPNHLILGNRFAGDAPDIWDIAGKYCDVVSFNIYPRIDVEGGVPASVRKQIMDWHDKAAKPMMVTEWSFPALDTDRPSIHGAGMRVDTQAQRAQCFTHFQTLMFSFPFMVGSDYFMYIDEPALGIADTFPEDSNYGLVNEKDEPYPELTGAARAVNARVYELHEKAAPPAPPETLKLAAWLSEVPTETVPVEGERIKLATGPLTVEGPLGGHAWRLWRGETLLGDYYPLLHQEVAQALWVEPDTARILSVRRNDRVTVVDMELSRAQGGMAVTRVGEKDGHADAQTDAPRRFRGVWRFWIPRDEGGYIASQCLWLENTEPTPWRLAELFEYLVPSIGGDRAEDAPLLNEVPNYYQRGAAWVDRTAGLGVGCWYIDEARFECSYWKDPGGGFHGDLRQKVDVDLQPGQRLNLDSPPIFLFSFDDLTRPGFARAAEGIARAVCVR